MNIIVGGFVFVAIGFVAMIVVNVIKATKDPDVIEASNLRMGVRRYKKYKKWYDEHQRLMRRCGIGSKEEQEFFSRLFQAN